MVIKASDLVGKRFGSLLVVGVTRIPAAGSIIDCLCDCGQRMSARKGNLTRGSTTSCGCVWRSKITTHGKTKSRVYVAWKAMHSRCKPAARDAHNYAQRGIVVCKRWSKFENFLKDMGDPPEGMTLERINNDKGYFPSNCKWASYKEQLNNRRVNNLVTAFGKTQSITLWAEEYKLPVSTLRNRLFRAGMHPEDALIGGRAC